MSAGVRILSTVDDLAKELCVDLSVDDVSKILPELIERVETFDVLGMSKKKIVIHALSLIRETVPADKLDDFDLIVKYASLFIDHICQLINSPTFKKIVKHKPWSGCRPSRK